MAIMAGSLPHVDWSDNEGDEIAGIERPGISRYKPAGASVPHYDNSLAHLLFEGFLHQKESMAAECPAGVTTP